MIVAQQKRKEHIAEYLLYMWQIEDLIRAQGLNMEKIREKLVAAYRQDKATKKEIEEWYAGLVRMMRGEGVAQSGHIHVVRHVMDEVEEVHQRLLQANDKAYKQIYTANKPNLDDLRQRMPDKTQPDTELALTALYGAAIMRMQGKTISGGTQQAIAALGKWLDVLSERFKRVESGELEV